MAVRGFLLIDFFRNSVYWLGLLRRRNIVIFVRLHKKWRTLLNFHVLSMLDQSNRPKQNSERNGLAHFSFPLFPFGTA